MPKKKERFLLKNYLWQLSLWIFVPMAAILIFTLDKISFFTLYNVPSLIDGREAINQSFISGSGNAIPYNVESYQVYIARIDDAETSCSPQVVQPKVFEQIFTRAQKPPSNNYCGDVRLSSRVVNNNENRSIITALSIDECTCMLNQLIKSYMNDKSNMGESLPDHLPNITSNQIPISQPDKSQIGRLEPSEIAKIAYPAFVAIESYNEKGVGLGSGFFIKPNQIVTNFHVIDGAVGMVARGIKTDERYKVVKILVSSKENDIAVLMLDKINASIVKLGDSSAISEGDKIYVLGNPEGFEGTFSEGLVSGFRDFGENTMLQISAPISHGSSGGPVFNNRGEVVGIASYGWIKGQNLNFAIPINQLKRLIIAE